MTIAERLDRMERIAARLSAELGISLDELAGVVPVSHPAPVAPVAADPVPVPAEPEPVDIGEVLDLDTVDLDYIGDGCATSYHDAIPYPDIDGAIHGETVRRGFVDPESLAVGLADDYWSAEDLEHDIKRRLVDLGYEVLDETTIYRAPDFGALLDEVQDLRNLSPDALPEYREYARVELQRRRDAGIKVRAGYHRRPQEIIDAEKAEKMERFHAKHRREVRTIDWQAAEREPVYQTGTPARAGAAS